MVTVLLKDLAILIIIITCIIFQFVFSIIANTVWDRIQFALPSMCLPTSVYPRLDPK